MNGLFIVFEGTDASGKTTLSRRIADMLKHQHSVSWVSEFTEDYAEGYLCRLMERSPFLDMHELPTPLAQTFMVAGAHAYKYETKIKPALEKGTIVLVDRYILSLRAYQGAIFSSTDPNRSSWLDIVCAALPPADITIYLKVDSETRKKRLEERGDFLSQDDLSFLERVDNEYSKILPNQTILFQSTADANQDIQQVYALINQKVKQRGI